MLIKSDLRNLIFQMIDDPQQVLWTQANMDLLTEQVMDELWGRIYDYSPFFTTQNDTVTPLTPGYVDLGLTGVGTGQLSRRIHKLQSCVVGNAAGQVAITYELADPRDVVLQGNTLIFAPNWRYVFFGSQLWLFPLDTTANSVNIRYSYKPVGYRSLGDSATIGWPDGHESALWYEVCARAISKGAREDPNVFRAMADDAFLNMISSIKNQQIGPTTMWTGDASESWGSV